MITHFKRKREENNIIAISNRKTECESDDNDLDLDALLQEIGNDGENDAIGYNHYSSNDEDIYINQKKIIKNTRNHKHDVIEKITEIIVV